MYCHAHPDDEASQTSGAMARAAAEGHRVVVVFATNGDHGEVAADAVEGETVADYRRREAEASARVLGLARIAWLGYADSGMTGWEQNDAETSFYRADLDAQTLVADLDLLGGQVDEAFTRLVDLVRRTSGDERNRAREHLLDLFAAVGNDDPRVLRGRQNLASALF